MTVALAFSSLGGTCATPSGRDWIFGTIEPNLVLRYKDRVEAPAWCKQPDKMLETIRARIADGKGCVATLDASSVLTVVCELPPESDTCQLRYFGHLWTARDPASASDYDLLGVGWVRNTCRNISYRVNSDTRMHVERGGGHAIHAVVNECNGTASTSSSAIGSLPISSSAW